MSRLNNDEFTKKINEKFDSIDQKLASIENNISKLLDMQKNVNKNITGVYVDFWDLNEQKCISNSNCLSY